MQTKREEYWSWDNRHLRLDVNRYGINYLLFVDMTVQQLRESLTILTKLIADYKRSISGISIPDQERQTTYSNALRNVYALLYQKKQF